jgi:hypothetical protein
MPHILEIAAASAATQRALTVRLKPHPFKTKVKNPSFSAAC